MSFYYFHLHGGLHLRASRYRILYQCTSLLCNRAYNATGYLHAYRILPTTILLKII